MAFVIDPIEKIDIDKDTTFVFMLEAQLRGHEVWYCELKDMYVKDGGAFAKCSRITVSRSDTHYKIVAENSSPLESFNVVWMRKDPPYNMDYIYATYILSLIDESKTSIINSPRGIRESNEKLYTLHFPDLMPPTVVTKNSARLKDFLREVGGEMVVKPLDGCGGIGIYYIKLGDKNVNVILENITKAGQEFIMAQKYVPEVSVGDKRIILLNGEPIGAVLRVADPEDFRCNFHSGGKPALTEITERDAYICERISSKLKEDGLYFVGIDVIGDFITEINTTSPTGIQEINRFHGVKLESQVMDFAENMCVS